MEQVKCYDKYNQLLKENDYVDVQKDGVHQIYKKEDNQLYFKPYGEEDMVSAYFSNDIAKCDVFGNWINNDRYEEIEEDEVDFKEPKHETLEEAAERHYINCIPSDRHSFIQGANWQAKRMYSEEEVRQIAEWSFHFHKTNQFDDSELEEEWNKLLEEKFKKK
jgi:hypothetical protein